MGEGHLYTEISEHIFAIHSRLKISFPYELINERFDRRLITNDRKFVCRAFHIVDKVLRGLLYVGRFFECRHPMEIKPWFAVLVPSLTVAMINSSAYVFNTALDNSPAA
jgi:hypothetical protein